MSFITKLLGIKTQPAKVEVIQAPARFSRERAIARLERIDISLDKLRKRPRKNAAQIDAKIARLEAESDHLRRQLGYE